MTVALALSLALAVTPHCLEVQVEATGRSAHGSAIMPQAAPHLLIKALARLPAWVEDSAAIEAARITSLEAAPAINVIPRRAVAVVDIAVTDAAANRTEWMADLAQALGPKVEIELLTTPCRPAP